MCIIIDLRECPSYIKRLAANSKKAPIPDYIFNWLKQKPESLIMLQDSRSARW